MGVASIVVLSVTIAGSVNAAKAAKFKRYKNIERLRTGLESVIEAKDTALNKLKSKDLSDEQREALEEKVRICRRDEKHIRAEIGVVTSLGLDQEPIRPTNGRITSHYGMRFHPIFKHHRLHTGIDFAGKIGTPVKAAWGGDVIETGTRNGYGNVVVIDHHDGKVTLYGHLSMIDVEVGQPVEPGEKVGEIGMTGLATGPHLHFEIRVDGDPIDPMSFFK